LILFFNAAISLLRNIGEERRGSCSSTSFLAEEVEEVEEVGADDEEEGLSLALGSAKRREERLEDLVEWGEE